MKLLAFVAITGCSVIAILTWRLFLSPVEGSLEQSSADAIFVFAGGEGTERLDLAIKLAKSGVAPVIIANTGALPWPGQFATRQLCRQSNLSYAAECIQVDADNTAGEARSFAKIAKERNYQRLVIVTSRFHISRASYLLSLCHGGEIMPAGATHPAYFRLAGIPKPQYLINEWGGLLFAMTVERSRGCDWIRTK